MKWNFAKVSIVLFALSVLAALPQGAAAFDSATVQMEGIGTFPILAFSQGVAATSQSAGAAGGASRISFQDAHLLKQMDLNTPTLFEYAATGKAIRQVTIEFFTGGAGGGDAYPVKYFTIKLVNVRVTSVSFSESKTSQIGNESNNSKIGNEQFSLDFEIIKWINPDGSEQGWNVKQNKPA
jgi:type VI secretion system Hcp family effector